MITLRYIFLILISLHGLVHLLGYSRAFHLGLEAPGTAQISKVNGVFWFMATCLFLIASVSFFFNKDWWRIVALASVFLSQFLIFSAWQDAKFGTIINGIILIVILIGIKSNLPTSNFQL